MRVIATVPLPSGFGAFRDPVRFDAAQLPDVRDPSMERPVGRVVAVEIFDGTLRIDIDLDEALVNARLGEPRRPF